MDIYEIRKQNLILLMSGFESQKDFAAVVETAPAYLSQITSDKPQSSGKPANVGNPLARKIESKLKLEHGWMDTLHLEDNIELNNKYLISSKTKESALKPIIAWEVPEDLDPNVHVIVPRVDVKFSAGPGHLVTLEPNMKNQGMAFLWSWLQHKKLNPKNLFTVDIVGDSMEPNIKDGSVVTIDRSFNTLEQVQSERVYAIRYGDELRIKRLVKRLDGALIIKSDNPKYDPETIEITQLEHISIIGKYVAHSFDGEI